MPTIVQGPWGKFANFLLLLSLPPFRVYTRLFKWIFNFSYSRKFLRCIRNSGRTIDSLIRRVASIFVIYFDSSIRVGLVYSVYIYMYIRVYISHRARSVSSLFSFCCGDYCFLSLPSPSLSLFFSISCSSQSHSSFDSRDPFARLFATLLKIVTRRSAVVGGCQ